MPPLIDPEVWRLRAAAWLARLKGDDEMPVDLTPKEAVEYYMPPMDGDGHCIGPDISTHQGDWGPNRAWRQGARFAIFRATGCYSDSPSCFVDYQIENNIQKMLDQKENQNNSWRWGMYHFFRPQYDAFMQARFFWDVIKDMPFQIHPVIDFELDGGLDYLRRPFENFTNELYNISGYWAMNYTRGMFWNDKVGDGNYAERIKLWISIWNESLIHPWDHNPQKYKPIPWDDWLFWQRLGDSEGMPKHGEAFGAQSNFIDLNVFNGSHRKLKQTFPTDTFQPSPDNGEEPPPDPPDPPIPPDPPDDLIVTVTHPDGVTIEVEQSD